MRSILAALTAAPMLAGGVSAHAAFVQFDLSGSLNRDIVFSDLPGDTAQSVDGDRFAYVTLPAAVAAGVPPPAGLPGSGAFAFGGGIVQFAPYDAPNAVHFGFQGGFGHTLATPGFYDNLTFFGGAANGNADVDVTLNYADGDQTTRVEIFNWFREPTSAVFLIQDMDGYDVVTQSVLDLDGISVFAFGIGMTVDPTRVLLGFDVVQINQGTNRPILSNVLAVTGNLVPEPGVLSAAAILTAMGLMRRRRRLT